MRVVIQRVNTAKVTVASETIGEINNGLCILVGFEDADNETDIDWMINKVLNLRIFNDSDGDRSGKGKSKLDFGTVGRAAVV